MSYTTFARDLRVATAVFVPVLLGVVPAATAQTASNVVCTGCVGSSDIADNSVRSVDVTNGSLTGTDIKNGSIGPFDLGTTVFPAAGTATSAYIDNFTSGTFTEVASKSITVPKAGLLLIMGTLAAEDDISIDGPARLLGRIKLDGVVVPDEDYQTGISMNNDLNVKSAVMSFNLLMNVGAGAHTVSMEIAESSSGSFIFGRSLNLLFLQNGTGVAPPPATVTSARPQLSPNR